MAINVILPRQGQSVESCIITTLFKNVGDEVAKGEVLFAYETDKASFEEEAPVAGILLAFFCKEGDEVPVLENICVIGKEGESVDGFLPAIKREKNEEEKVGSKEIKQTLNTTILEQNTVQVNTDRFISPRAKKLAEKEAISVSVLTGSGPNGRIIEKDVIDAKNSRPSATPLAKQIINEAGLQDSFKGNGIGGKVLANDLISTNPIYNKESEVIPLSNIRKIIAKAMHQSLQNSAQLTHHLGADARKIQALRKRAKQANANGSTYNITLNDMVCYALIKALKKYPQANAHFLGDSVRQFKKVHLGLAVDTERGLMVPVIKNADDMSIQGLSSQMKSLAESCRKGNVNPELLAPHEASFTVSNLGGYGVEMFTPVINLPQVAILGVNTILARPTDMGDGIYGFVPFLGLSLTYDHRAIDGGLATQFLKAIAIEVETLDVEL